MHTKSISWSIQTSTLLYNNWIVVWQNNAKESEKYLLIKQFYRFTSDWILSFFFMVLQAAAAPAILTTAMQSPSIFSAQGGHFSYRF